MTTRKILLTIAATAIAALLAPRTFAVTGEQLLSLVPPDAVSVGMVRVDDMRRSPTASDLFTRMSAGFNDEAEGLLREAGLRPDRDVDVIMIAVSPSATPEHPRVLVAASGRFDPIRLGNLLEREGATRTKAAGTNYFLLPEADVKPGEHPAICFYDQSLVLAGTEAGVLGALEAIRTGSRAFERSALGRELFRIDMRSSGWMLFDVQRAQTLVNLERPGATPFGDHAYAALKNVSTISLWVAETSDGLEFSSSAVAADAETRELVSDVLKGLLAGLRMAAQEEQPEMVKIIRRFEVNSSADAVTLTGSVPATFLHDFLARIQ